MKVHVADGGRFFRALSKGINKRFAISDHFKRSTSQEMSEVLCSFVDGREFPIVRAVILLSLVHFSGEECKRFLCIFDELL